MRGRGSSAFHTRSYLFPLLTLLAAVLISHRAVLFLLTCTFPWDFRGYSLPQAFLTARAIQHGEWPLWNPFIYCGHPFAANIQAALFYPPRIITVCIASITGIHHLPALMEWELVLHVLAAAVFAFWCGRRWELNAEAASLTGILFALGAYFASQAEHIGAVETAAWLPVMAGGLAYCQHGRPLRAFLEIGGALAMATLAGFTPLLLVLYFALAGLTALLVISRILSPRALLVVAGAMVFSWFLSAVILVPGVQLAGLSVGQFRADWRGTGGGIPIAGLPSLVWPNLFHILEPGKYSGRFEITFMYLYSGLIGIVLALVAIFAIRTKLNAVLTVLLVISGVAMMGDSTAIGRQFFLLLPPQIRGPLYPQHWLAVFVLSIALLAGFGLQRFRLRPTLAMGVVIAAAIELIAVSSGRPFNAQSIAAEPGVTAGAFDGNAELLQEVRRASLAAYPPYRIDTYRDSLDWVESAPVTGIPTSGGYDPLALTYYMQTRLAFCRGERWGAYYQVDDPAAPMLSALNVRYLLSRIPIPAGLLADSGFRLARELPGHLLYENPHALPRFYFVPRAEPASSLARAQAWIRKPSWHPADEAIVQAPRGALPEPGGSGSVQVVAYQFNRVELAVDVHSPALLASSEMHYPGWRAFIDGREVPIYLCNGAFRSIVVPGGKHIVRFRFMPSLLIGSGVTSLGAWLLWAILWFFSGLRGHASLS